jgi:hypothetical protein
MNTTGNILFLLVPEKMVGTLLLLMLMGAGLSMVVGARRVGTALFISAITFPIVGVLVTAILTDFFLALPEAIVLPAAFLMMAFLYLLAGWMIIKGIFGQKAMDHAKGEILADGARSGFRLLFSKVGVLTVVALLALAYSNFSPK